MKKAFLIPLTLVAFFLLPSIGSAQAPYRYLDDDDGASFQIRALASGFQLTKMDTSHIVRGWKVWSQIGLRTSNVFTGLLLGISGHQGKLASNIPLRDSSDTVGNVGNLLGGIFVEIHPLNDALVSPFIQVKAEKSLLLPIQDIQQLGLKSQSLTQLGLTVGLEIRRLNIGFTYGLSYGYPNIFTGYNTQSKYQSEFLGVNLGINLIE